MPIKVRCQDCKTVMGVPDKAAGRAVKCKECGARVEVPAGGDGAPAKKKKKRPAKKKRRPRPEPSFDEMGDDIFGGLNLGNAEHADELVCPNPKCAKIVSEDDIECPHCGVNIETGALSEEQRQRQKRKGPPPEEFYGKVWGNAWAFTTSHMNWVVRTAVTWAICLSMVIVSQFVLTWYIPARITELRDTAEGNIKFNATSVVIAPQDGESVTYDGKKYTKAVTLPAVEVAAAASPPVWFWSFLYLVFFLACFGWAWTLAAKIVELTMRKQKKIKRFDTDIFRNMMKGFTTIFWPMVLMWPAYLLVGILGSFLPPIVTGCLAGFCYLAPMTIFLPHAVVHMAQPYTYRAWLLNWMCKDVFNTFVPTLVVGAMFFFLFMIWPIAAIGGAAATMGAISKFYVTSIEIPFINLLWNYQGTPEEMGIFVMLVRILILFTISFVGMFIFSFLMAFPAVFMMRVIGLFGLYFGPDMTLCHEQPPGSDVGIGPRFLAALVDCVILLVPAGACALVSVLLAAYFSSVLAFPVWGLRLLFFGITMAFASLLYFGRFESGANRATLGKWSLGIMVLTEDDMPLDFGQSAKRLCVTFVNLLLLGIPFIIAAFHPKYRAMQDLATKTKVVWRGDEDM
ncbi:MAG TPA: hypothetical protein DCG12_21140 [Planctomycetaceae bacterium]|nr:hypothetical protein [Planctomycetaceae bacterium]